MRAELRGEHDAHALGARRGGDDDTGGGGDDQRRDLRDEAVADGEDRVGRRRVGERHVALHDADEDPAEHVDEHDEDAEDGVALHVLGRTVHGAVEVGGARDLLAARAGFLLVDEAGGEIGVDCHLLAGHRVEREARRDFRDAAGTLRDDDEVDADEDEEDDDADGVVAADDELAERLDHLPRASLGEDETGGGDIEADAEERQQEDQGGEAAELERVGVVERDEERDEREPDARGEREVEQRRGEREDDQRDDADDGDRETDFGPTPSGGFEGGGEHGGGHRDQATAAPAQAEGRRWRWRSTKARTSATVT